MVTYPFQGLTAEMYQAIVSIVDDRMREIKVVREGFDALRAVVDDLARYQRELAAAQARTEERVGRLEAAVEKLAEAQARTDEAIKSLAAAQARTEERVGRLEAAMEKLAAAQARTEERVGKLEAATEKLMAAQARTEDALRNLAVQVGKLSETVGFGLEDVAHVMLPAYLERHYQIKLAGPLGEELDRKFFIGTDGWPLEVRVGRHLTGVVLFARDLGLVRPGRGVLIEGLPDLTALRAFGLGPYLQPPSR